MVLVPTVDPFHSLDFFSDRREYLCMSTRLDRLEEQLQQIESTVRDLELALARIDSEEIEAHGARLRKLEAGWKRAVVASLTTLLGGVLALATAIVAAILNMVGGQ